MSEMDNNIIIQEQQSQDLNIILSSLRQGDSKRRQLLEESEICQQKLQEDSDMSQMDSERRQQKSKSTGQMQQNNSNQNIEQKEKSVSINCPPVNQIVEYQNAPQISLFSSNNILQQRRQRLTNQSIIQAPQLNTKRNISIVNEQNEEPSGNKNQKKEPEVYTFIHLIHLLQKFIKNLKNQIIWRYNIDMIENHHLQLIGDLSYIKQSQCNNKTLTRFQKIRFLLLGIIDSVSSSTPIFLPDSIGTILFDFIIFVLLVFELIFIPIIIAFPNSLDIIVDLQVYFAFFFVFDMLIRMNTGIYYQGSLCLDRRVIFQNYIKQNFLKDILAIIGLGQGDIYLLLFFCKQCQMFKLLRDFDDFYQLRQRFQIVFQLFKLALLILILANFCGCGFHYIYLFEVQNGATTTWIDTKGLEDSEWGKQYLFSLYYAIITMVTVGYGDITPQTSIEVAYVIVMTLISSAVFAYSINTIGMIFNDIDKQESIFRKKKIDLQNYLNQRNISKQAQIKMLRYLQYIENQDLQHHIIGENLISSMSKNLQEEFFLEYFGSILKACKIFKLNFSPQFIDSLSQNGVKEITIAPDEILFKEGQNEEKLYFLVSGELELYIEKNNSKLQVKKLEKGSVLGYEMFFGNQCTEFASRTLTICKLVYLTKQDFLKVINLYPLDYERYCYLKDQLIFSNKKIDSQCTSCGQYTHSFKSCPLIHLNINSFTFIGKYSKDKTAQQRCSLKRKQQLKLNALENRNNVMQSQRVFVYKLLQDLDYDIHQLQEQNSIMSDFEFSLNLPQISFKQNDQPVIDLNDSQIDLSEMEAELEQSQSYFPDEIDEIQKQSQTQPQQTNSQQQLQQENLVARNSFNFFEQIKQNSNSLNELEALSPEILNNPQDNHRKTMENISNNAGFLSSQYDDLQSTDQICDSNQVLKQQQSPKTQQKVIEQQSQQQVNRKKRSSKTFRRSTIISQSSNKIYQQQQSSQQSISRSQLENKLPSKREDYLSSKNNKTGIQSSRSIIQNLSFFDFNFETQKNFVKYFPQFNYNIVIDKYIQFLSKQKAFIQSVRKKKKQNIINQLKQSPSKIHQGGNKLTLFKMQFCNQQNSIVNSEIQLN